MRRRVTIIYNPAAGVLTRWKLARVIKHLSRLGAIVTVRRTAAVGHAAALAGEIESSSVDVVVAAGGDGTVNAVINGLKEPSIPIAVLPLGTANVLAAEIKMPRSAHAAARTILFGRLTRVNVGLANGRRFLMMAGVGFDAHVVAHVDPAIKRVLGQASYILEFIAGLVRFSFHPYRVTIDGISYEAASVVIANGRHYGGRFTCAPQARLEDPTLDVCLFLKPGPLQSIRYGLALVFGCLDRLSGFRIVRGTEVTIEGGPGEPIQCDGDLAGALPLTARIAGDQLLLVAG